MAEEERLNGHDQAGNDALGETEDLNAVRIKLSEITRGTGQLLSLKKTDVALLKSFTNPPEKSDEFIRIIQICDFIDEDEANRELDAFYEAVELGMSTEYNIAHALSRPSINRKGAHRNSRVASILDALSHQKFTSNMPKGDSSGHSNKNSPIG